MMNILRSKTCEDSGIIPEKTFRSRYTQEPIYEVRIGGHGLSAFLVSPGWNSCEQDAIDELLDYLESNNKYPGLWARPDDEYIQELRQDAIQQGYGEDDFVDEMCHCTMGQGCE